MPPNHGAPMAKPASRQTRRTHIGHRKPVMKINR